MAPSGRGPRRAGAALGPARPFPCRRGEAGGWTGSPEGLHIPGSHHGCVGPSTRRAGSNGPCCNPGGKASRAGSRRSPSAAKLSPGLQAPELYFKVVFGVLKGAEVIPISTLYRGANVPFSLGRDSTAFHIRVASVRG